MGHQAGSSPERSAELVAGSLVAERYRITSELGRGGMAVAYAAHDTARDRVLALKRLLPSGGEQAGELRQLFEREYHTLQQLSHPRVVEVYDYGRDDGCAFYTMEWLGGGDLGQLSPLPADRVCALLSDVSSALSLIHSRGLMHRDVTPRNIRCTEDGLAKLIDFGAIAPFGSTPRLVGTPPFCPPEAVHGQELDGRVDLFALGATAYFALTGRHAYGARSFETLLAAWRTAPRPPSHYASGVPAALDALVLSLLSLDRAARPQTAAEVMERLCVIGGRDVSEQLVVQQAYLTSPRLSGRKRELARVRELLEREPGKRARAALIIGEEGMGRSRFLASSVLEAKLHGAAVARANASDQKGPFGVVNALVTQVLEAMPALADEPSALLLSSLHPPSGSSQAPAAETVDSGVQARYRDAARDLLLRASAGRTLMLAVDDAHLMDERSAALLALLTTEARHNRLLVAVTLPSMADASGNPSLRFFVGTATVIEMQPLSLDQTESLLQSIFGDIDHLRSLTDRLHRLSSGSPGALMQLAQHLLDRGVVRYQAGSWLLPAQLDPGDLPSSLQAALEAKLARLSPMSARLAMGLSLVEPEGLSLDEIKLLLDCDDTHAVLSAVDEL